MSRTDLADRFLSQFALGTALAATAVGIQLVLGIFFARDSYQLFLGAVAVSAIRGGTKNGTIALAISAIAKSIFLLVPSYPGHGQIGLFLSRIIMFILVGSCVCFVGGAVYLSLQSLDRDLSRARLLRGLLPICASCKRIRDERGGWCDIESYISRRSDAEFSHGFCPKCAARFVADSDDAA